MTVSNPLYQMMANQMPMNGIMQRFSSSNRRSGETRNSRYSNCSTAAG